MLRPPRFKKGGARGRQRRVPPKSGYFTAIGLCSVKTPADKRRHAACHHRRIQELKVGAKVERRRREPSRGAKGVKGVFPPHRGRDLGRGAVPLPKKIF